MKRPMINKIVDFFRSIFRKVFLIDDTPQKIALGFGLGVFLGIFPGTGPIAALILAAIFRINKAAALIACLFTNTWISIVTFLLSIKAGAVIMRVDWQELYKQYELYFKNFRFYDLFKVSALKIVLPLALGYILVGLVFGLSAYLIILIALKLTRGKKEERNGKDKERR
jgi:uncharacterized protein (DUF2062 family)